MFFDRRLRFVRLQSRGIILVVITAVCLGSAGVTFAAIIPGVDSIYPTSNTGWICSGSSTVGGSFYCQTDNNSLTFGLESMTATQQSVFRNMMSSQYNPTDLNTSEESPISYSGSSETDIVFQVGTLGAGINGITWCNDSISFTKCDQHYVRIIPTRVSSTASTPCHETGHAVGLTHGSNASPTQLDDNTNFECLRVQGTAITTLGAHNYAQINGEY